MATGKMLGILQVVILVIGGWGIYHFSADEPVSEGAKPSLIQTASLIRLTRPQRVLL